MAFQPKDMTGTLFKNDRKDSDRHPDYTGSILVHGKSFWLSAWIKEGQRGKFMSLAIKPKDQGEERPAPQRQPQQPTRTYHQPESGRPPAPRATSRDALDDEIPW